MRQAPGAFKGKSGTRPRLYSPPTHEGGRLPDETPAPGSRTRRQELAEALARRAWTFEQLRHEFQLKVRELDDELRHVARSVRRGSRRLVARPASCEACGFRFKDRAPTRFHDPGRCPRCRSQDIRPGVLRVEGG